MHNITAVTLDRQARNPAENTPLRWRPVSETINETHSRCVGVSSIIRESDNDLFALELVITNDDRNGAVFKVIYGDDLHELLLKQHQLALIFST